MVPTFASTELSDVACRSRLRRHSVGRLIYHRRALPAVHATCYVIHGKTMIFEAPRDGFVLHEQFNLFGFHVDQIDPTSRTGWTVTVLGELRWLDRRAALDLRLPGEVAIGLPARNADDPKPLLALTPMRYAGRLLSLPEDPEPQPTRRH